MKSVACGLCGLRGKAHARKSRRDQLPKGRLNMEGRKGEIIRRPNLKKGV
jgi:hypothetical protein